MLSYTVIVYFVLFGLAEAANFELTLTRYKGATSLSTGPDQFSIINSQFRYHTHWLGVEMSGNLAAYFDADAVCIPTIVPVDELPEIDRTFFQRSYNGAYGDDVFLSNQKLYQPEIYKFKNGSLQSSQAGNENFILYEIGGYSVFMFDELNFLVTKNNMPDDYAYILSEGKYVGLVLHSGEILFTHEGCQGDEFMVFFNDLRKLIGDRARDDRKLLNSFENNFGTFSFLTRSRIEGNLNVMTAYLTVEDNHLKSELDKLSASP